MAGTRTPLASLLVPVGGFFFRSRNAVFPLVFSALVLALPPAPPAGSERLDRWTDVAGFAVALAGQSLRVAVIGYAYVKRGGKHGRVYAARLVTRGFFGHSRNPLYLGNLLILLGLFIIHNNPWVYAVGIAFFAFAYRAIVAAEEAYLRERFGEEYEDYCRRVSRWVPRLRGLRRSLEGLRFDWRRVVVKEYGTTYAWIATALLLVAYEQVVRGGYQRVLGSLALLLAGFAVATAGWAAARYVKKGSLIGQPAD